MHARRARISSLYRQEVPNPRGREEGETRTETRSARTSGTLLIAGGLLFGLMNVVTAVAFPGFTAAQTKEALWTPAFVVSVLGIMMVLFGLPALYSRIAGRGG